MPFVNLTDVELYYEIEGSGPPLVMLTGLGGAIPSWAKQRAEFAKHYQLIMLDNRGSGQTKSLTDAPFDLKTMARDVIALLDHLNIESTHLLGFSMGGRIAQHIALDYPERIKKLVLGATAAYKNPKAQFVFQTFIEMLDQAISTELKQKWLLPWLYSNAVFDDPKRMASIGTERATKTRASKSDYQAQFDAIYCHDRFVDLSVVQLPTLLLVGKEDMLTPPSMTEYIHKKIASSTKVEMPGGHNIHVESSQLFNETVLSFLAKED